MSRTSGGERTCGVTGLWNHGASCWVNAAVQAVYSFPTVRQALLEGADGEGAPGSDTVQAHLHTLAHEMLASKEAVAPSSLLLAKLGYEGRQEDASVALTKLLASLPSPGTQTAGREETLLRCTLPECGRTVVRRTDEFQSLEVEMADTTSGVLRPYACVQEAVAAQFRWEDLDVDLDSWQCCSRCSAVLRPRKRRKVTRWPEILSVTLKRFGAGGVPSDGAMAGSRCLAEGPPGFRYVLHASILHRGSLAGGHYTAVVRTDEADQIVLCDDSRVQCSTEEVLSDGHGQFLPYIYLYGLVKQDSCPATDSMEPDSSAASVPGPSGPCSSTTSLEPESCDASASSAEAGEAEASSEIGKEHGDGSRGLFDMAVIFTPKHPWPKPAPGDERVRPPAKGTARFCSTYAGAAHTSPPPPAGENESEASDGDTVSVCSNESVASDASDAYHVAVHPSMPWETTEDMVDRHVCALATELRDFPLLPPDPTDATRAWRGDVHSGEVLPHAHCTFSGCAWVHQAANVCADEAISDHLGDVHADAFLRFAACPEPVKGAKASVANRMAYYCAAIRVRERAHMPRIGLSVDRRTAGHVREDFSDSKVRSLICMCCAQVAVDTGHLHRSAIRYTSGAEQIFEMISEYPRGQPNAQGNTALTLNFSEALYRERYAPPGSAMAASPALQTGNWEWRRRLRLQGCADDDVLNIICCPEDVHCIYRGVPPPPQELRAAGPSVWALILTFSGWERRREHDATIVCPDCCIPVCLRCEKKLKRCDGQFGVPMALANDNLWGYVSDVIYKHKVRWIEAAVAMPAWTCMLMFYLEADHGHLMDEVLKHAQYRTAVRGNCFSMQMPYEQILKSISETKENLRLDTDPAELALPHGEDVVAKLLRMKIVVGTPDILKHVLHVTLRPHVVCALLDVLLAGGHPAFGPRSQRALWREKLHAAVAAKYPEPPEQAALPEEQRNGFIPAAVRSSIQHIDPQQEPGKGKPSGSSAPSVKRKRETEDVAKSLIFEKAAAPAPGPADIEEHLASTRPQILSEERSGRNVEDGNVHRVSAMANYTDGTVQTGSQFLPQWESSYISEIQPFCIPYNVSGVDYRPTKKRWRRTAPDAPAVSSTDFTRGAARRVEGQTRNDWSFVPLLRNLHFRWSIVTAAKLDVERGIRAHVPSDDPVTELIKAPQNLYNKLWHGRFRRGQKKYRVAGDLTRLKHCEGLTPLEKGLLKSVDMVAATLGGTPQIRQSMGHCITGGRAGYGDPVFMTLTPNAQHSALVCRLSRHRHNDPINTADVPGANEMKACIGRNEPSLEADVVLELPSFKGRAMLTARDPLAILEAFNVEVRVVLARLLGLRMCPECPHCNAEGSSAPCSDIFGSNMRPMGGVFGAAEAMAGAVEHQRNGTPHLHFLVWLVSIYQFCTLEEIQKALPRWEG
jgi:hypothetical protein